MTTRQAKLQIGLDIKPLRDDTRKAKEAIEALGKVKIDGNLRKQMKEIFGKQLVDDANRYKMQITQVRSELERVASTKAFDPRNLAAYAQALGQLNRGLSDTNRLQRNLGGGGGGFGGGQGGGGGGGGGNPIGRGVSSFRGAMGTLGIGVGIAASMSRQNALADSSLAVRALTGGNTVGGGSQYGFDQMERLQRGQSIARGLGRNTSEARLSSEVNRSEKMERAFGISGDDYGRSVGAARKAGISGGGDFAAKAIGDAVAMGLTGSAVGEYLSSMTGYLESVSKGVNVNSGSLRGFASALGSIDFFRKDPSRIFDVIQKMEAVFKGGGTEYQKMANYQAIQETSQDVNGHGLEPAQMDVRQMLGLFGADKKDINRLGGKNAVGDLADVLNVGGGDVMKNNIEDQFRIAKKASRGSKSVGAQMFMRNAPGMDNMGGIESYIHMDANGGKLNAKDLVKAKDAMKTPEELAKENMATFDGSVKIFVTKINTLENSLSRFVADGTIKFVSAVSIFDSDMKNFATAIASFVALKLAIESAINAGKGGGGGGNGKPGAIGAIGTIATGIMALPAAAALGTAIGKAMKAELDEWTKGSWSKLWDEFWGHDKKRDAESIAKYATNISSVSEKHGVSIPFAMAQERAEKLGKQAEKMRDEGKSQKEIDESVRDQIQEDANEDREKAIGYARYKRSGREKKNFKPTTKAEMDIVARHDILKFSDEDMDKAYSPYSMSDDDTNKSLSERKSQLEQGIGIESKPNGESYGDPKELAKEYAGGGVIKNSERGSLEGSSSYQVIDKNVSGAPDTFKYDGKVYRRDRWSGDYKEVEKDTDDFVSIEKTWKDHFEGHAGGGTVGVSSINGWSRGGSMGRDNIDAKMMGGEFVVNARDASKNMMALVHANAGGKIKSFADGGAVGGSSPSFQMPMAVGGGVPDFSPLHLAIGGNTEATHNLSRVLAQVAAGGGQIRGVPQGPSGARYGRG